MQASRPFRSKRASATLGGVVQPLRTHDGVRAEATHALLALAVKKTFTI